MSMLTNLDLIRRVPLFSLLSPNQAQLVADGVLKRRFRRGETLVEQGLQGDALFILLNGRARVTASDTKGREVILAVLGGGDYVGEMSLIDGEAHSATVRAEVQTDTLVLSREAFARCLPDRSHLAHPVMRGLVKRLRAADHQIESLALLDVYGRVARTLLEMSQPCAQGRLIRGKVSRQDMAKRVGASREMVSRVMKNLELRGFMALQPDGTLLLRGPAPGLQDGAQDA
ncbi:MAG: Crp/Fnr family transcriptional regulator [Burkholderiales bacterium]|jgi:CRP/FNR family transcriptional regulator, cyclic AMP receptor protein|nr:Crp/Fnr family transcriptional regulator [Burkholderiales bacterium]